MKREGLPALDLPTGSRIVFAGVLPAWHSELEWELALVEQHQLRGHETTVDICEGQRIACEARNASSPRVCVTCVSRRAEGESLLPFVPRHHESDRLSEEEERIVESFIADCSSWQSIWEVRFENYDVGIAALSTIVSCQNVADYCENRHRQRVNDLIRAGIATYLKARRLVRSYRPNYVYILTGRMTHSRAWLRACEAEMVEFATYDHGSNWSTIKFFPNGSVHSPRIYGLLATMHWRAHEDDPNRSNAGAVFYTNRRERRDPFTGKFIKNQNSGYLPEWWTDDSRWITVFTSSEDEFRAIGDEWAGGIYGDQLNGVRRLASDPRLRDARIRLVVRLHPRMAAFGGALWAPYRAIEGIHVIPPGDNVDSYTILDASEKVLSFGSTMGIEATYWGRPSILLGPTLYSGLDACYAPQSHDEVVSLCLDRGLMAASPLGALIYGYFLETYEVVLEYLTLDAGGNVLYKGRALTADRVARFLSDLNEKRPLKRLALTRFHSEVEMLAAMMQRSYLRSRGTKTGGIRDWFRGAGPLVLGKCR